MTALSEYSEARERWTWRNQVMNDGRNKILSDLRVQDSGGCAYFALVTTLESNLRVQLKRSASLSIPQLRELYEISKTSLPGIGKIKRLLLMIKDRGICEEEQYTAILRGTRQTDARRYKIVKYYAYNLNKLEDIKHAMCQLRNRGPLLAVINISRNYKDCNDSGLIYRFDPDRAVKDDSGVVMTHPVSVVSFAVEAKVPCLVCQESRGQQFGRSGFLAIDITSVVELYSIKINLSSS